jgi:hypothetical protein
LGLIASLRRLGWRGVRHRASIAAKDLPDWLRTRLSGSWGRSIRLLPWRLSRELPAGSRVVRVLAEAEKRPVGVPAFYGAEHVPGTDVRPASESVQPQLQLVSLAGVTLLRNAILLDPSSGRVVPVTPYKRGKRGNPSLRPLAGGDQVPVSALRRHPSMTIEGPAFLATSAFGEYGHVLLEAVPRLLFLGDAPPDAIVLTTVPMTGPYPLLFEAMGVPLTRVRTIEVPTHCAELYVPDSLVDYRHYVSPLVYDAYDRIRTVLRERSSIATAERIYVSRRGIERRSLREEDEVEALFSRYGFLIVRPETMAPEDQIRLFSDARMIAGPAGSAMHNMVFGAPDTRVLLLASRHAFFPIDAMLTRTPGTLGYVLGASLGSLHPPWQRHLLPWSINVAEVEEGIKSHFGL